MPKTIKLLLVAAARPNFIKISPLITAIERHNAFSSMNKRLDYLLIHTGQHYDIEMSKVFFKDLKLPTPHINLGVGSGPHAVQTAEVLVRFEKVCLKEKPDWVVVVGDVNSTMACSLTATKLGIKVAHVEAGLRSFDRSMPEEINRLVTDSLSDVLFTPSKDADENLKKEGIPPKKIKCVGNIMIDTLVANLEKARTRKIYEKFGLREKEYVYVTIHRPFNVDEKKSLSEIVSALKKLSKKLNVIFPVHPRTKKNLSRYNLYKQLKNESSLYLCEPLGYIDSIGLIERAFFVLTDSGGIQEETTYLGVPCLTLRPNTERPITLTHGTNQLCSLNNLNDKIEQVFAGRVPKKRKIEYWDGKTSERIVATLKKLCRFCET